MSNRGKLSLLAGAGLIALLLGCKKGSEAAPTASAAPAPAPAPTPEAPAQPEPAASASAEPAKPGEPVKGPAVVPAKVPTSASAPDAGTVKDAGVPDAAADAGKAATAPAADAKAIEACCGALAAEAKKPGPHTNKYRSAAAVCSGIAASVKKGAADAASARTTIRAQLQGVPVPGGC